MSTSLNCPAGTTTSPCLGDEFVLDGCGDIRVNGARSAEWPFMLPIGQYNGLHQDETAGIWTSPHGAYRINYLRSASGLSLASPFLNASSSSNANLPPFTVTNPSTCQSMTVFAEMQSQVTVTMGNAGTLADHRASLNTGLVLPSGGTVPATGVVPAQSLSVQLNPSGSPFNYGWADQKNLPMRVLPPGSVVPPGGSVTYYPNQEVWGVGPATITGWLININVQAILIDSTQEGGVS